MSESLLAVDSYRGFDGVRRFWGEFLSAWERYRVETLRFDDAGDQVAVVVHIVGRTTHLLFGRAGQRSDRSRGKATESDAHKWAFTDSGGYKPP